MLPILALGLVATTAGVATTAFLLLRHRPDTGAPQVATPSRSIDSPTADAVAADTAAAETDDALPLDEPEKRTVVALPVIAIILATAVLLLGVLILMIEKKVGLADWDQTVERWAAAHASSASTNVIAAITQLGSTGTVVLVALVVGVFAYVRTKRLAIPAFLATVVVGQWFLANLIKLIVERARPALDPLASFSGASFPSGHTTAAAATYLAVALVLGLFVERRARAVFMGVAVAVAVAVGCSRALLGVHWFTDVIGGLILGWAWYAICSVTFGGRRFEFGAAVRDVEEQLEARS